MEQKHGIFEKNLKNGQNDHILGKMSKNAKIDQNIKIWQILDKFDYFMDILTFLDILPRNEKIKLFSLYKPICRLKTLILA